MSTSVNNLRTALLCASSLMGWTIAVGPTFAQVAPAAGEPAPSPAAPSGSKAGNPEAIVSEVIVTGASRVAGGLMKVQTAAETMSSITAAAIQEKVAAASPLQLVSTIPGVNFGSSDAYGLTVRDFLSVRGLDQTELGFMIENVPGTDYFSYFPYSEAWADNENISDITLTPGNSRLQDPIISASGGEFIESIRNPRSTFGGMISQSIGSYDGWRTFADIDTGYIGQTGAKAFLSYSHTSANNFAGPGNNHRDHIDFKGIEDWSPHLHSSLFFSYNYWVNARVPFLSLTQAKTGLSSDNFSQFAYASTYTPGVATPNYYRTIVSPRTDAIVSSTTEFELSDKVSLRVTPYFKYNRANAGGEAADTPTSIYAGNQLVTPSLNPAYPLQNGKLFLQNENVFQEYHYGVNSTLEADLTSHNHLLVGYWHENYHVGDNSYYNQLGLTGAPDGTSTSAALRSTNGALITGTHFTAQTTIDEFYVGDTQSMLDDKLKLSVGFKEMVWSASGVNEVIGSPPTFSANFNEALPRILVSYDLNQSTQIYANITTNARFPVVPSTYLTDFSSTTGAVSQAPNPSQKPEYSIDGQIGYRYHGALILDASVFYMHLVDHQLSSTQNINGTLVPIAFTVGNETIKGASLEVSTHSYGGFSAYGSAQYLDGTFDDNTPVGGTYLPTRGKQMVESPPWVASVGGRYDRGPFFAEVTAKYVASQYTSFMNDQSMPSYETVDLNLGYRLPDYKMLSKPIIRLDFTNLSDKSYISIPASVVTNTVATNGLNGTTIKGGTPLYYIAAPLTVMFTISSNF